MNRIRSAIVFPNSIKEIKKEAFKGCKKLKGKLDEITSRPGLIANKSSFKL